MCVGEVMYVLSNYASCASSYKTILTLQAECVVFWGHLAIVSVCDTGSCMTLGHDTGS